MTIKKITSLLLAFLLVFSFGFRSARVSADSDETSETTTEAVSESTTQPETDIEYEDVTGNKILDFLLNFIVIFSNIIYEIMEAFAGSLEEPTTLPPTTTEPPSTTTQPTTQPEEEVFRMCCPMEGETVLRATFPTYADGTPHYGIDIANPDGESYGKDIYAAESGMVISAYNDGNWNGGFGNYVQIDHGNGIRTLYAHASSVTVTVGQKVEKGQKIGEVGSTGNSTAAHLHFEVRKANANGYYERVNPLDYVSLP